MSRIIDRVIFGFTGFDEISLLYYDENRMKNINKLYGEIKNGNCNN